MTPSILKSFLIILSINFAVSSQIVRNNTVASLLMLPESETVPGTISNTGAGTASRLESSYSCGGGAVYKYKQRGTGVVSQLSCGGGGHPPVSVHTQSH